MRPERESESDNFRCGPLELSPGAADRQKGLPAEIRAAGRSRMPRLKGLKYSWKFATQIFSLVDDDSFC
jgi:hypothetical protein